MASKYVPALQTCLTRALAAHLLLTRRGHPARLHVGVAKHPPGVLHAHAWIESDGEVVVGGTDLAGFTPLYVGQLRDA